MLDILFGIFLYNALTKKDTRQSKDSLLANGCKDEYFTGSVRIGCRDTH